MKKHSVTLSSELVSFFFCSLFFFSTIIHCYWWWWWSKRMRMKKKKNEKLNRQPKIKLEKNLYLYNTALNEYMVTQRKWEREKTRKKTLSSISICRRRWRRCWSAQNMMTQFSPKWIFWSSKKKKFSTLIHHDYDCCYYNHHHRRHHHHHCWLAGWLAHHKRQRRRNKKHFDDFWFIFFHFHPFICLDCFVLFCFSCVFIIPHVNIYEWYLDFFFDSLNKLWK